MAPDDAQTEKQLAEDTEEPEVHIRSISSKSSVTLAVAFITTLGIIGASWIARIPSMEPLSAYRGAALERQLNRLSAEYLALTEILKTLGDKTVELSHNDDKADSVVDTLVDSLSEMHDELHVVQDDILNIKNNDSNCIARQRKLELLVEQHEDKYYELYEKVTTYQGATKERDSAQDRQINEMMRYFYRRGIPD